MITIVTICYGPYITSFTVGDDWEQPMKALLSMTQLKNATWIRVQRAPRFA